MERVGLLCSISEVIAEEDASKDGMAARKNLPADECLDQAFQFTQQPYHTLLFSHSGKAVFIIKFKLYTFLNHTL